VRIGIIGDSPALTTGFGITTKQIACALSDSAHQVVCFGLKGEEGHHNPNEDSFRILPIPIVDDWPSHLSKLLKNEKLDALLINMDIFNLKEVLTYCNAASWTGPTIAYLILDGTPVYREYLETLPKIQVFMATTNAGRKYLNECGVTDVILAPPGVDPSIFKPSTNVDLLRQQAGLQGKFVVGVFGRNTERKQQARVLLALSRLRQMGEDNDVVVYFHCQTRSYFHLDEIAEELDLKDNVIFSDDLKDESAGVPYADVDGKVSVRSALSFSQQTHPRMDADYTYVERINCCDLIINVAHCGDFEQVIIESQSCGIPLAATNDGGIMAEAMGDGGILLEPADITFWKAGQKCFLVSIDAIANAVLSVKEDAGLRAELRERGFMNARNYSWDRLRTGVIQAIETAGPVDRVV